VESVRAAVLIRSHWERLLLKRKRCCIRA